MAKLTTDELDRLSQELASYARTGVPMPAGLHQLSQSLRPGRLKEISGWLAQELERGTPLSEALAKSPIAMAPEFVALVRCGEISGDLQGILEFSVDHSRRLKRHRAALLTTLIYPVFVFLALVISVLFMTILVVPKFKDIYDQLGAELPTPTQIIIDISEVLQSPLGLVLVLGPLAWLMYLVLAPSRRERLLLVLARVPGFRSLTALSDTALWTKFIGRMMARSVPLPDAIRAASLAVWLRESRVSLLRMGAAAEKGEPVGGYLSPETPSTAAWLFARAEERGDLPQACEGIAAYCEDRFDRLSKRAVAVLEPLLLVLIALAVGAILISFYLPLFNIPKIVGMV